MIALVLKHMEHDKPCAQRAADAYRRSPSDSILIAPGVDGWRQCPTEPGVRVRRDAPASRCAHVRQGGAMSPR